MELSRAAIEKKIKLAVGYGTSRAAEIAAETIWNAVAKQITESENRIIDAEFALQELKSKSEERQFGVKGPCARC